jgi:cell division protein FtsN
MAKRSVRKKVNRRGARRTSGGTPAWLLLFSGILIGLAVSLFFMFHGSLSDLKAYLPGLDEPVSVQPEAPLDDDPELTPKKETSPRYDFFTVLPEMEVVVPEQELAKRAQPADESSADMDSNRYILQVGSFRNASDAEQRKAQLALMGLFAKVQTVTVNDAVWHRVRIGPVNGARKADEMRRQLQDGGFTTLVMKAST